MKTKTNTVKKDLPPVRTGQRMQWFHNMYYLAALCFYLAVLGYAVQGLSKLMMGLAMQFTPQIM